MYKRTMKYVPALAVGLQLVFSVAAAQAQETVKTETTTQGEPQVIKSFMVPTMTQTKETTDASGETTKTSSPMIMERHEQVVVPREKTTTETTIDKKPTVVEETTEKVNNTTVVKPVHKTISRAVSVPRHHVTHRVHHAPSHVAQVTNNSSTVVKRTVVEQPTVVEHTEHTVSDPVTYERKDPALGQ